MLGTPNRKWSQYHNRSFLPLWGPANKWFGSSFFVSFVGTRGHERGEKRFFYLSLSGHTGLGKKEMMMLFRGWLCLMSPVCPAARVLFHFRLDSPWFAVVQVAPGFKCAKQFDAREAISCLLPIPILISCAYYFFAPAIFCRASLFLSLCIFPAA